MGLQRTPPQRAQGSTQESGPSDSRVGETALPSPSQAFQPRNPRVVRSPLSGSTSHRPEPAMYPENAQVEASTSTTPRTAPPHHDQTEELNVDDEAEVEGKVTEEEEAISQLAEDAYTTPLPQSKRRKSHHPPPAAPEAASAELAEITGESSQIEKNAMYGKRYEVMMDTLEMAVKASSEKWTLEQFTQCFPKFAAENRELFGNIYETYRSEFRRVLWKQSEALIDVNRFGPALRKIEDAVAEAKANTSASDVPRPDTWRPDLNAKIIGAAANLPVHDKTYARLRAEYLHLHADCTKRYASIAEKQALLTELEGTVSDGVVDLDKTIKLLDGFPDEKMVSWMESILPTLPVTRS